MMNECILCRFVFDGISLEFVSWSRAERNIASFLLQWQDIPW